MENEEKKTRGTRKSTYILFLILACLLTALATNLLTLRYNQKVILPARDYLEMRSFYEDNNKLRKVEEYLEENYLREVDSKALEEGKLKGMVRALKDPYSQYLTEDEFKSLMEETSGSFGGIGVVVTPGDDNLITVVSPMEGTPGFRAGIRSGDKIIEVDGKEYSGETMTDATKAMKGDAGTDVEIVILRDKTRLDLKITREIIRVDTIYSQMLEEGIGYISIVSFDELTHKDFVEARKDLEAKGMKSLIIDVRNNPGGLMNITADIANEFLGKGTIVYTEDRSGNRDYLNSDSRSVDYPLVVLVNEASASASEILAGALKDRERATVVGRTTFGKGVVQRLQDFKDGSGIKLTISEYFTPNGKKIHGIGVIPDIEVESPEDLTEIGPENLKDDLQLQKAIEVLK